MLWFSRDTALVGPAILAVAGAACADGTGHRTIEFEASEVTQANLTVSPSGEQLVFTMLGHLFQLPVEGGAATQLTFGAYYDTDPAFSPDGRHVAFISDRDGSEGNVFLLDLQTHEMRQLTHETWTGRPAWSPDGETVAYLSYLRRSDGAAPPTHATAFVRTIPATGGESQAVTTQATMVSSVFYLPDGRLAWSEFDGRLADAIFGAAPVPDAITRIRVRSQGETSTLRTVGGIAHRFLASPAGDGFLCRVVPAPRMGGWFPEEEQLLFVPVGDGAARRIAAVSGTSGWDWGPRFAVTRDGAAVYVGEGGAIRQITLSSNAVQTIAFNARVRLDVYDPIPPLAVTVVEPGHTAPPRTIHQPRVVPGDSLLVFGAAGFLWRQPYQGGRASIIYRGPGFARSPTPSPDGRMVAYVESNAIKVLELETGQSRTLATGGFHWQVDWSPDSERLIYGDLRRVVMLGVLDGTEEVVAEVQGPWQTTQPQFSSDGQAVYFSDAGTLYRLATSGGADPEPLTELTGPFGNALVSSDGEWLVFARRREIWAAPLGETPVQDEDARRVSARGGDNFSLVPGSTEIIYGVADRVWRQSIAGGGPEEVPVGAELLRPTPPPLLLRRVQVLDFDVGGFGPEASLFIEGGRIRWIGSERGRQLPDDIVTLDGAGRFVIPGLFDLHVHSSASSYAAFMAYGVTSVRDTHRDLVWVSGWADRADVTNEPIPRHLYAGEALWGAPEFLTEEHVREAVRELQMGGVSFIKAYATLSWPLQRMTADEARRVALPVVAHGMSLPEIVKGVTLGYAMLEHSGFRLYEDVLRMFRNAGTHWDPTIGATFGYTQLLGENGESQTSVQLRSFFPSIDGSIDAFRADAWKIHMIPIILSEQTASVRAATALGIPLHAGTDAPDLGHLAVPGLALHWELEHLTGAGITPLRALQIATQDAATAMGAEDDLGTLEVGKLADIVVLAENPLDDIRNTHSIWRVVKGGFVFDPAELRSERN